jgi:hypothetical protein
MIDIHQCKVTQHFIDVLAIVSVAASLLSWLLVTILPRSVGVGPDAGFTAMGFFFWGYMVLVPMVYLIGFLLAIFLAILRMCLCGSFGKSVITANCYYTLSYLSAALLLGPSDVMRIYSNIFRELANRL